MDKNFGYPCYFCSKKYTKKCGNVDSETVEKFDTKTKSRKKIEIRLNRIEESIPNSRKITANNNFTISYNQMRWKCNLCGYVSNDKVDNIRSATRRAKTALTQLN